MNIIIVVIIRIVANKLLLFNLTHLAVFALMLLYCKDIGKIKLFILDMRIYARRRLRVLNWLDPQMMMSCELLQKHKSSFRKFSQVRCFFVLVPSPHPLLTISLFSLFFSLLHPSCFHHHSIVLVLSLA